MSLSNVNTPRETRPHAPPPHPAARRRFIDGRLTGSEAKGLEDYDADKNGKITFDEFVEGKSKKE